MTGEITAETVFGSFTKNRVQAGAIVGLYEHFEVITFYEHNPNPLSGGKESDAIALDFNMPL